MEVGKSGQKGSKRRTLGEHDNVLFPQAALAQR